MKPGKKLLALAVAAALMVSSMAGCATGGSGDSTASGSAASTASTARKSGEVKQFKAFFAVPGTEINDDNEVQKKITDLIGAKCKETWLTGQSAKEAIGTLIAGGEYPDFVDGSDATRSLVDAGAFIQLDNYIDKYPNIKKYFTEEQWDAIKNANGGHIYYLPQFSVTNGKPTNTIHNDEAFWIQTRVLKWANYPKITTMDQYFDLIEKYLKANPTMKSGTKNIGYTILCDDWRYFCLENAPQFLDGYPNDGSCIVDPKTLKVIDYNTTPTAKTYFQKLNAEYKKGIVDPESFTQKYDQYISKLSTGAVLGMIDQYWDFSNNVNAALKTQKLDAEGCEYVPLPITIKEGVKNQWHTTQNVTNVAGGVGITTSCKDVEGALQFINDLLSPEVVSLRAWGVKDTDYNVGTDGMFTRTQAMRDKANDTTYKASHFCSYSYLPNFKGQILDNKNAATPAEQISEFQSGLSQNLKECFKAYNAKTYVDMLGDNETPGVWYPIYTFSDTLSAEDEAKVAWTKMADVKHQWLPKVCMSDSFDSEWNSYMTAYKATNAAVYMTKAEEAVKNRVEAAKKYETSSK